LGREDDQLRQTMSANCRAIALAEYSLELQAKRYIELYKKIL
jgi:glycosyltransferase involved in cell wall biosynthesis